MAKCSLEGVHFVLSGEEHIEVITEFCDGAHTLYFITAHSPHLVILGGSCGEVSDLAGRPLRNYFMTPGGCETTCTVAPDASYIRR